MDEQGTTGGGGASAGNPPEARAVDADARAAIGRAFAREHARKTVAVIGASADRHKFGNKAVRAFRAAGWRVFAVNPRGEAVEGIAAFRSVEEIAEALDVVSLYVAPAVGLKLLPGIAAKRPGELWINPSAGDAALLAAARAAGLRAVELCSILKIGLHPAEFPG